MWRWCLGVLLLVPMSVAAQTDRPVVGWENVTQLQSVGGIDYADAPEEAGELISGWLRLSSDGAQVVTINRDNDLLLWETDSGELQDVYSVRGVDAINTNMMDIAWSGDDAAIHSLHTDGTAYYVGVYSAATGDLQVVEVPAETDAPVRVWADADPAYTWVEVMPSDSAQTPYVLRLAVEDGAVDVRQPSAPEADAEADVRIGRMPAPLAVTATEGGTVRLWDLEGGAVLADAQVDGMPVFGHMNGAAARKLVWRDPASQEMQLLDFETGENITVASLDGAYVQALLLAPPADVVVGVNIDFVPEVLAWEVSSGEQVRLGAYRECSRTPDMVQMSADGTTLVIGCDTGLDIWRVKEAGA